MSTGRPLLPGQPLPLPHGAHAQAGTGTYAHDGYVVASTVGYGDVYEGAASVRGMRPPPVVPAPGDTVLGRVTRVTPRQANVAILVVGGLPCGGTLGLGAGPARGNQAAGEGLDGSNFQAVIRSQDVRATEKDSVVMRECFRPGDIVRAVVISLGDARSYYLSTEGNNLGVVHATSTASTGGCQPHSSAAGGWDPHGRVMQPESWRSMVEPVTGATEPRKCAKPEWL